VNLDLCVKIHIVLLFFSCPVNYSKNNYSYNTPLYIFGDTLYPKGIIRECWVRPPQGPSTKFINSIRHKFNI
jgi:hypothetical protein